MSNTNDPIHELSKIYNPTDVEKKWYQEWEKAKAFEPKDINQKSYTLMIPPPNVTGILTMGHVLNNSIQDVLVRKARMQGNNTLWLPGTDHASIATETKVTNMLEQKGLNKKDIGRETFLKHSWEWKEKYGGIIIKQLKRLGASCDWNREVFTMDENYSNAVLEVFVKLYNEGLIYKGERIINWDPLGQTALSDEEVIYRETESHLWYFKYPIKNEKEYLVVATTRPETMLGDTGIAVNPKDTRYKKLIGKTVLLPITNREIPIFGDDYVDMEFGTGCVKVTPAHDPNDFDMGKRNNLEFINIFDTSANLNKNVPKAYQNLDRFEARKKIVTDLKKLGLLEKIEEYTNSVGYSERTDSIVEPYMSKQWFVKMDSMAKMALEVVKNGEVNIYPKRWIKTYNHWLENIRDWCISRQLWWGHRIPVWYRNNEEYCGLSKPEGSGWIQDSDVLDTWFSSWLWPFATLGWPNKTDDLAKFYPTQDLVTGPDIIFFWVARMIMAGKYFCDDIPFSNVYFTGIIRDSEGKKMSKSLGNSPDPIDLFDKYGADAVRVSILMIAPQGLDILFSEDKLEQGRNFMNKIWNSARFILMNLDNNISEDILKIDNYKLDAVDQWILSQLNKTIDEVNISYEQYKINEAIKKVYDFTKSNFCDWYIEFVKTRFYGTDVESRKAAHSVSVFVIREILKLLHPYCPFITEELWQQFKLKNENMIILEDWPFFNSKLIDSNIEKEIQLLMDVITSIRNIRSSLNISPGKEVHLIVNGKASLCSVINKHENYLKRLAKTENIKTGENQAKPPKSATAIIKGLEIFIPLEGLIDINKEIERLQKQIEDITGRLGAVNKKLDNNNFIKRAPIKVIDHERKKQKNYKYDLKKLKENLNSLKI